MYNIIVYWHYDDLEAKKHYFYSGYLGLSKGYLVADLSSIYVGFVSWIILSLISISAVAIGVKAALNYSNGLPLIDK